MQDQLTRRQPDVSGSFSGLNFPIGRSPKAPAKCGSASHIRRPNTKSRRIIVRVPDELYEALIVRSRELGCNLSHALGSALDGSIKPDPDVNAREKPILRTAEIDALVDHYRSVVSEDFRHVRKRLFGHLLAAPYVTKTNFPRTPGSVDGYQALLLLQHLFGYGEDV